MFIPVLFSVIVEYFFAGEDLLFCVDTDTEFILIEFSFCIWSA
jgi:hypothetical protein